MDAKTDNYFLDTEFHDPTSAGFSVDFISVGLVAENKEFYGVYDQINEEKYRGEWIEENVIRKLPPQNQRLSVEKIREGLLQTFHPAKAITIWAHNGSYDFYILARIFGGQLAFRKALLKAHGIETITFRDTKEITRLLPQGYKFPVQEKATEHIAIHDARHERDVFYAASRYRPKAPHPGQTLGPV